MTKRRKKTFLESNPLLAEEVDRLVAPWLLIALFMVTGLFVVLQYIS